MRAGSWASNRGRAKFTVLALDTAGKPIKGQSVAVKGRVSQIISTAQAHGRRLLRLRQPHRGQGARRAVLAARPTTAACCSARRRSTTAGQVELIAEAKDAADHPATAAATVWITKQGELWFSRRQRRPDRRAAREEALRAGRGRAAAGAHAVSRGDRAGRGRARGRDRDPGDDPARRGSDGRAEGRAGLGAERLCQRAGPARPDPRDALVLVLHLGLEGAGRVVAELSRRRQGLAGADGDGRSRQAGVQARRRQAPGRSRRARAAGERHGRQAAVRRAPDGDGEDQGDARRQARWPARTSPSPRSTRACWRCAPTTPGTCSRR